MKKQQKKLWLWHHINCNHQEPHPAAEKCIVIFSAYLDSFKAYLKTIDPNSEEMIFAKRVTQIGKGDHEKTDKLTNCLEQDRKRKAE